MVDVLLPAEQLALTIASSQVPRPQHDPHRHGRPPAHRREPPVTRRRTGRAEYQAERDALRQGLGGDPQTAGPAEVTTTPAMAGPAPRRWIIDLPCGELLTSNELGLTWGKRHRITEQIQHDVGWIARAQRIPAMAAIRVDVHLLPPDRTRRDPHNWQPSAKAAIDALVQLRVIPDDNPAHLTEVSFALGELHAHSCTRGARRHRRRPHLRLIVTEVLT